MEKTYDMITKEHPDWKIIVNTDDMNQEVNCASCGKKLQFGDTYTGINEVTNEGLFGLPVCETCYFKEMSDQDDNDKLAVIKAADKGIVDTLKYFEDNIDHASKEDYIKNLGELAYLLGHRSSIIDHYLEDQDNTK